MGTDGAPILKTVRGDGDGWVVSVHGTHHWGRHGAAGLLLRAPWQDGTPAVLLQHRAAWSHQGDTWGLPGGALDSHEAAEHAAVVAVHGQTWTYTTVVADASELLITVPNRESAELRWVPEAQVADLPLHPAFAMSWARLRTIGEVPAHDCGLDVPHTVVSDGVFGWCAPR